MQVRVDSDRSPVGLLGDLASLAGSLFSLSSPVTDPITRLSVTLEGRYAIEREIGEGGMPELEGKTLADWAEMRGMPPTMETGAELVIDAIRRGGACGIYHVLDEADVEAIMRHPMTAIASDGRLVQPGEGHPTSSMVRDLSTRPRRVRARKGCAHVRRRGAQDDFTPGRSHGNVGARCSL